MAGLTHWGPYRAKVNSRSSGTPLSMDYLPCTHHLAFSLCRVNSAAKELKVKEQLHLMNAVDLRYNELCENGTHQLMHSEHL